MKYFASNKAKLRGWWCLSGFIDPYKIVESGNWMSSLVTCDHQSKNSFQNRKELNSLFWISLRNQYQFFTDCLERILIDVEGNSDNYAAGFVLKKNWRQLLNQSYANPKSIETWSLVSRLLCLLLKAVLNWTSVKLVKIIYWKTALNKTFVMFPVGGKREKERPLALNRARPRKFPGEVELRQEKANPIKQALMIRLMTANMKELLQVRVPLTSKLFCHMQALRHLWLAAHLSIPRTICTDRHLWTQSSPVPWLATPLRECRWYLGSLAALYNSPSVCKVRNHLQALLWLDPAEQSQDHLHLGLGKGTAPCAVI